MHIGVGKGVDELSWVGFLTWTDKYDHIHRETDGDFISQNSDPDWLSLLSAKTSALSISEG